MKTIWKYPLPHNRNELRLPAGAQILSVIMQRNVATLYALVDQDAPSKEWWEVSIYGTGWGIGGKNAEHFVGTVLENDGEFVWHVFAEKVGVAK